MFIAGPVLAPKFNRDVGAPASTRAKFLRKFVNNAVRKSARRPPYPYPDREVDPLPTAGLSDRSGTPGAKLGAPGPVVYTEWNNLAVADWVRVIKDGAIMYVVRPSIVAAERNIGNWHPVGFGGTSTTLYAAFELKFSRCPSCGGRGPGRSRPLGS